MRERKLVERAVRISGMFVLLSGMGLQPCLASHSYNAAPAGVVQVEQQKQKIEETAHGILDARALFPDSSLADLYDPLTMPVELRKAHIANDKAVMAAYGFGIKMTEEECVAELMKLYQKMQG